MALDVRHVYCPSSWRFTVSNVIDVEVIPETGNGMRTILRLPTKLTWKENIVFQPGNGFRQRRIGLNMAIDGDKIVFDNEQIQIGDDVLTLPKRDFRFICFAEEKEPALKREQGSFSLHWIFKVCVTVNGLSRAGLSTWQISCPLWRRFSNGKCNSLSDWGVLGLTL